MTRNKSETSAPTRARVALLASALLASTWLGACASDDTTRSGLFEPYRTDLPQGNYVTQEMLDRIAVGSSTEEVRRVMGTPLLIDGFLPDRWNYIFRYKHPNGRVDQRHVTIVFDAGQRVARINADALPPQESPSDPALPGFRPEAYGATD